MSNHSMDDPGKLVALTVIDDVVTFQETHRIFSATVKPHSHQTIIECAGELDLANSHVFEKALDAALEGPPLSIRFDWSGVDFAGMEQVRILRQTMERAHKAGIEVDLVLSPKMRSLLKMLDLWEADLAEELAG